MTLLVLAAGLGVRYGGLKQLEPMTRGGECIIDFSVYDAISAGFDRVVFVIQEEHLAQFRDSIGKRFEGAVQVEYVFQDLHDVPEGIHVPKGRTKPWGTAHALLAARNVIHEPFAVINADDFYGRSAFVRLAEHLSSVEADGSPSPYCMVGYTLGQNLTDNGSLSRAVCDIRDGYLCDIVERTKITYMGRAAVSTESGKERLLSFDTVVSMNAWGFTPDVFDGVMRGFSRFIARNAGDRAVEYYLPSAIKALLERGECTVKVYPSEDAWCGVTYRTDRDAVVKRLAVLKKDGVYPGKLSQIGGNKK